LKNSFLAFNKNNEPDVLLHEIKIERKKERIKGRKKERITNN
jgi:hypothetical protein